MTGVQTCALPIYAVVWTTVIIMIIINFITNPLYMAHVLEQPWWTFYPAILRNLVSCGVLVVVFKALSRLYTPTSWLTLILSAVVLAVVGGVLHMLIVCSREDWKLLREKVRRKSLR